MLIRQSSTSQPCSSLTELGTEADTDNVAWLDQSPQKDGVILLGGTSLLDFRIRVAQSVMRRDLLPSLWSHCGILVGNGEFVSVPLWRQDAASVPLRNGVVRESIEDYRSKDRWPNIAVIRFATRHDTAHDDIERIERDRSIVDLPALAVAWLGYLWGVTGATNPLEGGSGLPAAAFVESVFGMGGLDVTPGSAAATSSPEAIWQAAKWWEDYYKGMMPPSKGKKKKGDSAPDPLAHPMVPTGSFRIGQTAAAVYSEPQEASAEGAQERTDE